MPLKAVTIFVDEERSLYMLDYSYTPIHHPSLLLALRLSLHKSRRLLHTSWFYP
jgi:hypothetical protein